MKPKGANCDSCGYQSRFHGGNACKTNNGESWLFGLLYTVPHDNWKSCAEWIERTFETDHNRFKDEK